MARKVYKTTDKINIKIDDIVITISPLSFEVKTQIQSEIVNGGALAMISAAKNSIKHSVKGIKGLENLDGTPYVLEFEDNVLTDECVSDLLNIDQDSKISFVCTQLLQGVQNTFTDPQTGKPIKGISIEAPKRSEKKK